LACEAARA
jgi:hypothetical protein